MTLSLANLSCGSVAWLLLPGSVYEISLSADFERDGHVRLEQRFHDGWRPLWTAGCDAHVTVDLLFGEYLVVVDGPDRVFVTIKPAGAQDLPWMPTRPLLLRAPPVETA